MVQGGPINWLNKSIADWLKLRLRKSESLIARPVPLRLSSCTLQTEAQ